MDKTDFYTGDDAINYWKQRAAVMEQALREISASYGHNNDWYMMKIARDALDQLDKT